MSDLVWVALIAAVPGTISAIEPSVLPREWLEPNPQAYRDANRLRGIL